MVRLRPNQTPDRETDRETERQMERQTERQTDRQIQKFNHIQPPKNHLPTPLSPLLPHPTNPPLLLSFSLIFSSFLLHFRCIHTFPISLCMSLPFFLSLSVSATVSRSPYPITVIHHSPISSSSSRHSKQACPSP
ncbi:hypothetical protein NL108_011090 [Boleophthalmus pectinirostris]|nr:hypothetical protein NL108_011090 [Boleophthalmus pectinirostris]